MERDYLTLKRASASRFSGEWNDDDYDVLCDAVVVGRIMQAPGPVWPVSLPFGYHEDRTPTHGYAASAPTRQVRADDGPGLGTT
jgi:hypothetical protein